MLSTYRLPYVLYVCLVILFLLMPPHDGGCHDKEPNVDKNDHHHWHNEGPDKISPRIQKATEEIIKCMNL